VSRRTVARDASLSGVGLHLGVACRLTVKPAPSGSGIVFCRADLAGAPIIPARVDWAVLTERRTQLGTDPVSVHTVEHVLAAIAGLELDDLIVELDAPEPPIGDGSAGLFVDLLRRAGIAQQPGTVQYLRVTEPVRITEGESRYEAYPADDLELDVSIDFAHPLVGRQSRRFVVTPDVFERELATARTFGFAREVDSLRGRGLIKGGSTQSALVLDEAGVVDNVLRWPDEFVRHKALDCVGDLALAGGRVRARVVAERPSHRGTVLLLRAIIAAAGNGGPSETVAEERTVLGIEEIMRVLPHRYPFLLVDRILELEPGKRVVGLKNVTINEPFFQGHFPGHPIMPGVLIIEAMAQVGGVLLLGAVPEPENRVVYFTTLNNVKWRRPVKPGDQLRIELELLQVRGSVAKMSGVARVDGEVVAEAEMGAMVRER
jgi:UDP-3-O-[3-hydroxymyristoyl] N-acetylglucosamine deacetylase/3-hydroxyacyl-[acyl-carrier-protein] dehydratase